MQSADARNLTRDPATEAELANMAAERIRRLAKATAAAAAGGEVGGSNIPREGGSGLDAALSGTQVVAKDLRLRARTPYSSGFLFTVQSESKHVDRRETDEKMYGQTRASLLKRVKDSKKAGGDKLNPRAMSTVLTGRNKMA